MSRLHVARRPGRRGLVIPLGGTRANPNVLIPLDGVEKSELDELIRAILAKGGITDEATVHAVIAKAESDSEVRAKVYEARREVRRLLDLRFKKGATLMQRGYRRWKEVFYPATHTFKPIEPAKEA